MGRQLGELLAAISHAILKNSRCFQESLSRHRGFCFIPVKLKRFNWQRLCSQPEVFHWSFNNGPSFPELMSPRWCKERDQLDSVISLEADPPALCNMQKGLMKCNDLGSGEGHKPLNVRAGCLMLVQFPTASIPSVWKVCRCMGEQQTHLPLCYILGQGLNPAQVTSEWL